MHKTNIDQSNGIKQGDNLSSCLFQIFINALPGCLKKSLDLVVVNSRPVHCLLYADGIVMFFNISKSTSE